MGDCVCPHEVCSIHGDNTKRALRRGDCICGQPAKGECPVHPEAPATPWAPVKVETNPQPHAPGDLALEVARAHASEEDTPLGVVSRALLRLAGDGERRFGLLVARQTWLEDTERIQREVYDLQPAGVPYLRDQAFADVIEIAEMLQCLPWKDSRDGTPGRNATASELEAARGELVDSVIFKGNQAVALGFTDDTLWPAVNQKAMVNVRKRQGLGKEVWG